MSVSSRRDAYFCPWGRLGAVLGPSWGHLGGSCPEDGSNMAPRWTQDGSKMAPRAHLGAILGPSCGIFGRLVEAKRLFLQSHRKLQDGPKMAPRWPQEPILGPSWGPLVAFLGVSSRRNACFCKAIGSSRTAFWRPSEAPRWYLGEQGRAWSRPARRGRRNARGPSN